MSFVKLIGLFALPFILHFYCGIVYAQVWSEPMNITNDSYHDSSPDICIDNNGELHCVWVKRFNSSYRSIYYNKSIDQGLSWTSPIKISPHLNGVAYGPTINVDLFNNLHVIYKYDISQPYLENYYFIMFNGQNWSTPITICDEYPGAFMDEVVMDHQDRLYVFWHGFEHHPFYKYYENGIWSEVINIYTNFIPSLYLEAAVSDTTNNLHCIGYFNQQPVYLFYNFANNEWNQPYVVGIQSHYNPFEDIVIDEQGSPYLTWREQNFSASGDNATVLRKKTGDSWGELELVIESFNGLALQNIDVIFENILIVQMEENIESYDMMIYRKNPLNLWNSDLIYNYYRIEPWKVLHDNDYLYVLMLRQLDFEELLDVFITKAPLDSLTTFIKEETSSNEVVLKMDQNFPNPFIHETNIYFELNLSGNVTFKIMDFSGREFLNKDLGFKNPGKYSIHWDGYDDQKKDLSPGLYFYTIIVNGDKLTRSLIIGN
jgi:hypothetical protein